jgi:hypothetical protein
MRKFSAFLAKAATTLERPCGTELATYSNVANSSLADHIVLAHGGMSVMTTHNQSDTIGNRLFTLAGGDSTNGHRLRLASYTNNALNQILSLTASTF